MRHWIINQFSPQSSRTRMVQRNIIGNIFVKGISIILSLIIIPLTLGYVSEYNYGIWVALTSVIGWMTYFDIGVNNGLRNKLTQAVSNGNLQLARKYVSTTYAILILIFGSLFILFIGIYKFIDWNSLFSVPQETVHHFSLVVLVVAGFICFRSVLSTVLIILFSYQKSAISAFIAMLEQALIVCTILILVHLTEGSLLNLCIAYCGAPLLVLFVAGIIMFNGKYKSISPSLSYVDWKLKNNLFNLGLRFFVIQIAGLIQFQTINFIILKAFGPVDVTAYNISFKYFNVLYMIWSLMLAPLWNAITEAKETNDYKWIINAAKKYQKLFLLFVAFGIIMLISSNCLYNIWLGNKIQSIPFCLSLVVFLYAITLTWGSLYVQILNGLGALRIQFYASIISPIVFILMCYILISQFHVGIIAIVISSIIANFNGIFLAPYQYYLIINKKKPNTLWSKLD